MRIILLLGILFLFACSSIDCPVKNTVAVYYDVKQYDEEGELVTDTLKDTLWVWSRRVDGQDTLLNRLVGNTRFSLPISYQQPEDTLIFAIRDTSLVFTLDTVWLRKDDIPHFESVDCSAHFFHRLTDVRCTHEGIDSVIAKSALSVKGLPVRQVITSFAGLRAHEDGHEFVLGEPEDAENFYNCAGIESPGLSAAPAIGVYIAGLIREKLHLSEKESFVAERKDILNPAKLSLEERNELIRREPAYGTIICRCESVTEGEIIDAIRRPVGARSLDGVKRRTRAGMGRCQAGFCSPKVMEILRRELNMDLTEVTKSGGGSYIVNARTKDGE